VLCMLMNSVPGVTSTVNAQNENSNKTSYAPYIVGAVLVGAGIYLYQRYTINKKAAAYYQQGLAYEAEGRWDLAVDAYEAAARIKPHYRDVDVRIAKARGEAEKMFIRMGDEAKVKEQFEEALDLYQKALQYLPASTLAKARIEELGYEMVAVYYRRGRTYETQNRWQEAHNEYAKAYNLNPQYQDLAERYTRAKAQLQGNLPVRALLFFVNRTDQPGIENVLIQALQKEMEIQAPGNYALVDYRRVQSIIREQASALSANLDTSLAMDLGRLLGANEVITGEILSLTTHGNQVQMRVATKLMSSPQGKVIKNVELDYKFDKQIKLDNLPEAMPELARELSKRILK